MTLDFLARVRRSSLIAGLVVALALATVLPLRAAGGFAAGIAWCLVNLRLLEALVVDLTGAERKSGEAFRRQIFAGLGMLGWFGVGAALLFTLPPIALAAGFTFPFLVLLLKALSLALLESALWRRITANPWQAALLVALLAGGTWWAAGSFHATNRAGAQSAAPTGPRHELQSLGPEGADPSRHPVEPAAEAKKDAGPKVFPNFIGIIAGSAIQKAEATGQEPPKWAEFLEHFEVVIFSMIVALIISIIAIAAARNPQMVPGPLQNLVEMGVETASNFFTGILGEKYGPRLVPFLGTLFIYIFMMNIFGLIPFMHSPTSSLNITVAMALTVFVYVQFTAFKELGPLGWLDHMAGSPRSVVDWCLVPLMLPVHLIGEIAKPISLSCRLFGNIFGEDMLLVGFATLGVTSLSALHLPFGLPLQLPFMFLAGLITSPVQALVFTMLSTIYFLLMLPHDDHGHEHHEGEAHHNAH